MCGRYALGINLTDFPHNFNETVINDNGRNNFQLHRKSENHYRTRDEETSENIDITLTNATNHDFNESYNIPPTNNALIVYLSKNKDEDVSYHYNIEVSSFGLLPNWAEPKDDAAVKRGNGHGPKYSREVGRYQSRFFNCRKESLESNAGQWNAPRKYTRCVVPIQGYFEWLKNKSDKIPYYIHKKNTPLIFLAGMYAHNTHYNNTEIVTKGDTFFSSFTIITGPALKSDPNDLSWLHDRKPIMLQPGSKEWFDWLDPEKGWDSKLLDTSLNTHNNKSYKDIIGYVVSKQVGNPTNKSKEVIEEEKKSQKNITSFFQKSTPKKEEGGEEKSEDNNETTKRTANEDANHSQKRQKTDHGIKQESQLSSKVENEMEIKPEN